MVTGITGPHGRGAGQDMIPNPSYSVMVIFFQSQDCSKFKKEYCPVNDRSVIMVDNSIKTAADCQVSLSFNKTTNWLVHIKKDNLRKALSF